MLYHKLLNKNIIKLKSKKRTSHNIYNSLMNKFMTEHIIEMPEYTFMTDFAKNKGPIVGYSKYNTICSKIISNEKVADLDKTSLKNVTDVLFKHLLDLIQENSINVDTLVKEIEDYNKNQFSFTKDQTNAIKHICEFLCDNNQRISGLYGFAGTGKTTTITKLIHYLLYKNYIRILINVQYIVMIKL